MTTWRMLGTRDEMYSPEQAAEDMAAVRELHAQQIAQFGKEVVGDLPDLDAFPVWLCLVCEHEGKIVGAWYAEQILEMCMIGDDPRATIALRNQGAALAKRLGDKGFRLLRTFIPKGADSRIGRELGRVGFTKQDETYEHYLLDMRT